MTPFLGLRTALYNVPDLARAKTWYSAVLGHGPYFDQPYHGKWAIRSAIASD